MLGYTEAARLLEQTLTEEKNADKKLTRLAESFVNERAASEDDTNDYTHTNNTIGTPSSFVSGRESYRG